MSHRSQQRLRNYSANRQTLRRDVFTIFAVALFIAVASPCTPARAQINDTLIEQIVFQQQRNPSGARKHLADLLEQRIEDVHRECKLTDEQKDSLRLAGQGDINRFFDHYEAVKASVKELGQGQLNNEIQQQILPLQRKLQNGLHDEKSLFYKSLRNTLNPEQYKQYIETDRKRDEYRWRARVEIAVAILEQSVPFNSVQREALIQLLMKETKVTTGSTPYDFYVIQYQASRIPDKKLTAILDKTQWAVIEKVFAQGRMMEPFLKQQGLLPE